MNNPILKHILVEFGIIIGITAASVGEIMLTTNDPRLAAIAGGLGLSTAVVKAGVAGVIKGFYHIFPTQISQVDQFMSEFGVDRTTFAAAIVAIAEAHKEATINSDPNSLNPNNETQNTNTIPTNQELPVAI